MNAQTNSATTFSSAATFSPSLFSVVAFPVLIRWIMTLTLFVLLVIALIELIKFLKRKNALVKPVDVKKEENVNSNHDPQ